jgi:broad specificity phosphatase PhoE
MASRLAPLGPLPLVSSPLLRCRQTAAALEQVWGSSARIEPAVAEIPSPAGVGMGGRVDWLRAAMAGTWTELGPRYTAYRDAVVAAVGALATETVVCSHFVAINAVIGAALGDDRLLISSLDNCAVTVVEVDDSGQLRLVEGGREADTLIR